MLSTAFAIGAGEKKGKSGLGWKGFYRRLERELYEDCGNKGWKRVHSASAFLAFDWYPVTAKDKTKFYLQLEVWLGKPHKQKFCFKVEAGEGDTEKSGKDFYKKFRNDPGERFIEKPRFAIGATIAVGWWKGEWLAFDPEGRLDY